MKREMKRLICRVIGHQWESDWRAIDLDGTFFKRIDCLRCGLAIDGAALKRISEAHPELERYMP